MSHLALTYIDRGDPSEYDFTKEDFITDLQWHDLNLSDIVPQIAQLIHIRVRMSTPVLGAIQFRKKGNINVINNVVVKTQVASIYYYEEFNVKTDSNKMIQYLASNVSWNNLDIVIRGWYV